MFILCPHCQFLVTLDAGGQPPARCPSCDLAMFELPAETPTSGADVPLADAGVADATEAEASIAAARDVVPDVIAPEAETEESAASMADGGVTDGVNLEPATPVADAILPPSPDAVPGIATATPAANGQGTPAAADDDAAPGLIDAALPALAAQAAEAEPIVPSPPPETAPAAQPADPEQPPAPVSAPRPRHARTAPSFARSRKSDSAGARTSQWTSVGVIAGLSLLLVLQLLLADRARLSADARWRPALSVLCNVLRCSLPPWREPAAFSLLDREVRPHPRIPGVLRVTAAFRNDARWPQPWPALLLTLSDVDGRAVGARVFDARDYLDASPTRTGLESGQSATIAMDVREPSPGIVAFTFEFH